MGKLINQTSRQYYEGSDGVENNGGNYGQYQFVSLDNIINQFMVVYVGEEKMIGSARKTDVAFHAQRGLSELSYDTLNQNTSFSFVVPPSLMFPLPIDYVNYTKICWVDSAGIERRIYPTSKTSNANQLQQNTDGSFKYETNTWKNPATGLYEEYGINASTKTSADGSFENQTPLKKYRYETRVNVTGDTRVNPGNGANNTNYLFYSPNFSDGMQILFHGDYPDIKVGQTVFGPGIPENTTVASVYETTTGNYRGTSISMTNPEYEADQLLDNPTGTAGRPANIMQKNTQVVVVDLNTESEAWNKYRNHTSTTVQDDYEDDIRYYNDGERYGIDPQHAQANGSYYINSNTGIIHFNSFISGKTVVIHYITDNLGDVGSQKVHKFAEEAMYKYIAHAILSGKAGVPEYQVRRLQKEKFAAVRKAKLRLSNLNLGELTQTLRGKSKHIKH
jgi:hypothetical protein